MNNTRQIMLKDSRTAQLFEELGAKVTLHDDFRNWLSVSRRETPITLIVALDEKGRWDYAWRTDIPAAHAKTIRTRKEALALFD